jgi:hypothetical protein
MTRQTLVSLGLLRIDLDYWVSIGRGVPRCLQVRGLPTSNIRLRSLLEC